MKFPSVPGKLPSASPVLLVALAGTAIILLLILNLILNGTSQDWLAFDPKTPLSNSGTASNLRLLVDGMLRGKKSLEYARSLKNHALSVYLQDPGKAESEIQECLSIEETFKPLAWQTYLQKMEIVDSLAALARIQSRSNRKSEALANLDRAYAIIEKENLFWNKSVLDDYLQMLRARGEGERVRQVEAGKARWQQSIQDELEDYKVACRQALEYRPAGMEQGIAVTFLADADRILARDFAFAGNNERALHYAQDCVNLAAMLPESNWQKPIDLAELALIQTSLSNYKKAAEIYEQCASMILDSSNPDILYLLPQRCAMLNLPGHVLEKERAALLRASADDILLYLEELKTESQREPVANGEPVSERKWRPGDKVQVLWDERLWAARVVDKSADKYKIHFVGFPDTQDEWFEESSIKPCLSKRTS